MTPEDWATLSLLIGLPLLLTLLLLYSTPL